MQQSDVANASPYGRLDINAFQCYPSPPETVDPLADAQARRLFRATRILAGWVWVPIFLLVPSPLLLYMDPLLLGFFVFLALYSGIVTVTVIFFVAGLRYRKLRRLIGFPVPPELFERVSVAAEEYQFIRDLVTDLENRSVWESNHRRRPRLRGLRNAVQVMGYACECVMYYERRGQERTMRQFTRVVVKNATAIHDRALKIRLSAPE